MSSDNHRYGNPAEFDVDLHSIYAAYLGDFDAQNIDWWDASWGGYFRTFNEFLGFGWEAMVVVDVATGRAHIAARREQIALFARMIKTRFGETLDKDPPSVWPLAPAPARSRAHSRVSTLTDLQMYKKLSQTIGPAELLHMRARMRTGEPAVVGALFHAGAPEGDNAAAAAGVRTNGEGYTWACIKTIWWEKGGPPQGFVPGVGRTVMAKPGQGGKPLILEVGLAALRCGNLRAVDVWPPVPEKNYRKAHHVIEEWVDKRTNLERPNYPRAFGFGRSQFVSEKSVERIVEASLGGLSSHDVDPGANTLVLLTVGDPGPIPYPASSTMPNNILTLDVLQLEFAMYSQAVRQGVPGVGDRRTPFPSLRHLLHQLQIPVAPHAPLGNAGNEAFYTLLAFQKLMMRDTRLPDTLFGVPQFAGQAFNAPPAAEYFAPPMPAYAPFNGGGGGSPYGAPVALPPPPPIRTDGRKGSSPSLHRASLPPTHEPVPLRHQATGESSSGRRPSSFAQENNQALTSSRSNSNIPRSQTVYWDDAQFASTSDSRNGRPRIPAAHNSSPSSPDQRPQRISNSSMPPPPSSLRRSQVIPNQSSSMPTSRSVSFHDERRPPTIRSLGSSNESSGDGRLASRSNSGTALGPSGLSTSHTTPTSSFGSGSGSASSGADSATAKQPSTTGSNKQRRSSTGVRHITGALSKFWVD